MNDIYEIIISNSAQKDIRKLAGQEVNKIIPAIRSLAHDPRPSGCKKLVNSKNKYRVRVGNYRVLYFIEDQIRIVQVSAVKHRREAYE
ncbi:MAG: type II toxin-antitoxin system RelE/ParE family toxin [Dyadobacter sp.]|uniref:type II toxin-antitoxin system RelE family toxin n=1 Tax=Dyadobacter sp. TaxID=1914288 RepID=UPI001B253C05|nr:type II toxin-antitoxin system RelE/ParE family toxin [Dyadobacter sp.]MBO9615814.1 type II toxin-antitoxin system RelE/ParE family toxin [Dyadobacter sp.]